MKRWLRVEWPLTDDQRADLIDFGMDPDRMESRGPFAEAVLSALDVGDTLVWNLADGRPWQTFSIMEEEE